jgi:hypothetical protein
MFSHHLSSDEANELSAWLRLFLTEGVGNETARQWLAAYGLPQAIFEADPDALSASPSERLRRAIETVPEALPALLASTLDWLAQGQDRCIVTLGDAHYPASLLNIADPPLMLYMMGSLVPRPEASASQGLAGMPCIGKPATATSYLTEAAVRLMLDSGLLPEGSLQLVIGGTGDLLDRLDVADVVTFTGSADTAAMLRVHPNLVKNSIPFNAEADSLNCAILGPDVSPDDEEFDLFVKEVAKEITTKAGQKCTAIRRAIVPAKHLDAVAEKLMARLTKLVVGDPSVEGVRMGALA